MLCLCACSDNWESPYDSLDREGYNISVRFDANGGVFAGTNDVYIVDVYNIENGVEKNGEVGFYLLSPEDSRRAEGAFSVSRSGYFLAGWYTERTLRVDEYGNALDEFGVLTSVSGREQGYSYSGRWDFESDLLTVDGNAEHSSSTTVATLYAAWVPYFSYDFYSVDAQTGETVFIESVSSIDLDIPQWNETTGKLDLEKFPSRENMTFDAAYLDAELTTELSEKISGTESFVDYETGTTSTESVNIYTTWLEGTWFKIYTAQQFFNNSRLDGNYMICADLDFEGAVWSPTLVKGRFSGKIYGNGYTISNITATQADNSQIYGGLFGTLESGAVIQDLTLENVTFTIEAGSRMQGAAFGLLAGSVSSDAALENVTVTGCLYISESCYPQADYSIGLLCGSGTSDGVSYTIECMLEEDNTGAISVSVDDDDTVTITFVQ